MSKIDELTELQKSLGYLEGTISSVAVLGLLGEAGEVGAEIDLQNRRRGDWSEDGTMIAGFEKELFDKLTKHFELSEQIDILKKRIRASDKLASAIECKLFVGIESAFDMELADVLYYVNALAINRGLTLEQLAGIAHEKVSNKIAKTNDRHL